MQALLDEQDARGDFDVVVEDRDGVGGDVHFAANLDPLVKDNGRGVRLGAKVVVNRIGPAHAAGFVEVELDAPLVGAAVVVLIVDDEIVVVGEGGRGEVDPAPDRARAGVVGEIVDGVIVRIRANRLGAEVRLLSGAVAHDA